MATTDKANKETAKSEIRINFATLFSTVFTGFTTQAELSTAANVIREQLVNAVKARQEEIANGVKTTDAETDTTNKTAPESKKSEVEKAKEVAKKLKETKGKAKGAAKPKEEQKAEEKTIVSLTDKEAIKKLNLKFEPYKGCWVLYGDTKPISNILKDQLYGSYNSRLKIEGEKGWLFRNARAQEVADALGIKVTVPKAS